MGHGDFEMDERLLSIAVYLYKMPKEIDKVMAEITIIDNVSNEKYTEKFNYDTEGDYPVIDMMKSNDFLKMEKLSISVNIFIRDVEWNDDAGDENKKQILLD